MSEPADSKFGLLSSKAVICLLLAVATLAVYSTVRHYGFVDYDDDGYFFGNPHVLSGLTPANVEWAFTSSEYVNWHPLTWLSLMLDATLFGKSAAGPHITNVLLHMVNSILVFCLFRRLTGAHLRSAALAMLFALHPLHVESVSWVAERKDVLSGFFGLLSLLYYARYAEKEKTQLAPATGFASVFAFCSSLPYWLTLLFYACGLMSKPMLVTLPFVMLLLDFWPLRRISFSSAFRLVVEKVPFFIAAGVLSVVTFVVQQRGGAVTPLTRFPMALRIENMFVSYARYLGKIFWPVNLATPYPPPYYWSIFLVLFCLALFVALCVAAVALGKKFPFVFTGWFWFAGMMVPVIGLVQVGGQAMADRYAYLPIIGILLIVVWAAGEICIRCRFSPQVIMVCAAILFFAMALRARNQVSNWRDDGTLFGHALAVTENNYIADLDYGYWYSKNGNLDEALHYYYDAVRMAPNDPTALYNAGNAFAKLHRWEDAIQVYQHALKFVPNDPSVLDNLGFALAQNKQLPEAVPYFEAALKYEPNSFGAHNNLGTVYFIQGRYADAQQQYIMARRLMPNNTRVMINLGDTYVRLKDNVSAEECYRQALQLEPNNETARARLQALGPQNPD